MNALLLFIIRLITLLLLYLFIGWIAYTIFTDLRKTNQPESKVSVTPITLIQANDDLGESRQFVAQEVLIGRDPANPFYLEDGTVSARHLKLTFRNQHWWAEDLESTNGSYLNGDQILSPVILTDGDELRLGQIVLTVRIN